MEAGRDRVGFREGAGGKKTRLVPLVSRGAKGKETARRMLDAGCSMLAAPCWPHSGGRAGWQWPAGCGRTRPQACTRLQPRRPSSSWGRRLLTRKQLVGATPAHQETSPCFARREPSGHTNRRLDNCVSHCHLVSLGLSSLTPRGFASTSHTPAPRPLTGGTDPAPGLPGRRPAPGHRAPAALGPSRRPRCPPSATPRCVGMPFLRFLCEILESPVLL